MKKSRDVVNTRRSELLKIIEKTGDVRVMDIAQHLKVSEVTVRRDLQILEDKKVIERYYGGARVRRPSEKPRRDSIAVCKDNIARFAASLVEDGDTIFINTSSTALLMLRYVTAKEVSVITNNGNAIVSPKPHGVKVILTGGELYNIKGTLVGEFALANINKVTAKKAFVGCSGLSLENGMTTDILNEVEINKAMLQRVTDCAYIIADHSKIGRNSSFVSCELDMITHVITDELADENIMKGFRDYGVEVHKVSLEETGEPS